MSTSPGATGTSTTVEGDWIQCHYSHTDNTRCYAPTLPNSFTCNRLTTRLVPRETVFATDKEQSPAVPFKIAEVLTLWYQSETLETRRKPGVTPTIQSRKSYPAWLPFPLIACSNRIIQLILAESGVWLFFRLRKA